MTDTFSQSPGGKMLNKWLEIEARKINQLEQRIKKLEMALFLFASYIKDELKNGNG